MFALRPETHPKLKTLRESFRELLGALSVEEITTNQHLNDSASRVNESFNSVEGGAR